MHTKVLCSIAYWCPSLFWGGQKKPVILNKSHVDMQRLLNCNLSIFEFSALGLGSVLWAYGMCFGPGVRHQWYIRGLEITVLRYTLISIALRYALLNPALDNWYRLALVTCVSAQIPVSASLFQNNMPTATHSAKNCFLKEVLKYRTLATFFYIGMNGNLSYT